MSELIETVLRVLGITSAVFLVGVFLGAGVHSGVKLSNWIWK